MQNPSEEVKNENERATTVTTENSQRESMDDGPDKIKDIKKEKTIQKRALTENNIDNSDIKSDLTDSVVSSSSKKVIKKVIKKKMVKKKGKVEDKNNDDVNKEKKEIKKIVRKEDSPILPESDFSEKNIKYLDLKEANDPESKTKNSLKKKIKIKRPKEDESIEGSGDKSGPNTIRSVTEPNHINEEIKKDNNEDKSQDKKSSSNKKKSGEKPMDIYLMLEIILMIYYMIILDLFKKS